MVSLVTHLIVVWTEILSFIGLPYQEADITLLQNFINLQSGTAVVQAQADLLREESDQATGARRGAAIGSIAQLAAAGYTLR